MHAHHGCLPPATASTSSTPRVQAIIKLGGAAITVKQVLETARPDTIAAVAQHVKDAIGASHGSVVVVHGAGSFGHQQASAHRVAHGPLTDPRVHRGFLITRASVTKLNGMIVHSLVEAGVPAVGISPFGSGWITRNRQVVADGLKTVEACMAAGMVPVLHGDAVQDIQLGCTILSGDTIVARLAELLKPDRVVFLVRAVHTEWVIINAEMNLRLLTDSSHILYCFRILPGQARFVLPGCAAQTNVAGVYDRPPEEAGAQLLRSITVQSDGSWQADVKLSVDEHDATGGMAKKIEEAAAVVAATGGDVVIAEAGTQDGRQACSLHATELRALGAGWRGTIVHRGS